MAIIVITDEQGSVVTALERAIDAGVVEDWTYEDGDFVLATEPSAGARFRSAFDKGAVLFGMLAAPGVPVTPFNYARLHARFLQLLLEHADRIFDAAEITPLPCDYDLTQLPKAGPAGEHRRRRRSGYGRLRMSRKGVRNDLSNLLITKPRNHGSTPAQKLRLEERLGGHNRHLHLPRAPD